MAISGLGSVAGVSGTQYDFTNMTNSQADAAAQTLFSEGKISGQSENRLCMLASGANMLAINPTTGASDPTAQASMEAARLSSTTTSNYIDTIKTALASDNYFNATKEAAIDSNLLADMETYQSTGTSSTATQSRTGGIISTTA
jgi:hypothetical protein